MLEFKRISSLFITILVEFMTNYRIFQQNKHKTGSNNLIKIKITFNLKNFSPFLSNHRHWGFEKHEAQTTEQ